MPKYDIKVLLTYCDQRPGDVIPLTKALKDANDDFGLKTKKDLLAFISNGGLEDLEFECSRIWEKNPNKEWIIKSFHLSKNNLSSFAFAFHKAGLLGDNT